MQTSVRHTTVLVLIVSVMAVPMALLRAQNDAKLEEKSADSLAISSLVDRLCVATATEAQIENGVADFLWPGDRDSVALILQEQVKAHFHCADLTSKIVPLFQHIFTEDELQNIVSFFECPGIQGRYRKFAEEGGQTALMGLDMRASYAASWKSCAPKDDSPGMRKWYAVRDTLELRVHTIVASIFTSIVSIEVAKVKVSHPEWKPLDFSSAFVAREVVEISSQKYADIASCLKNAGFKDMMMTMTLGDLYPGDSGYDPETAAEATEAEEELRRFYTLLNERVNEDTLIYIIAPVFDRNFTDKEMKSLASFYTTVAGKAYIRIKLRQIRNPERILEIFLEEFNALPRKERDRLTEFRATKAAEKFIEQSPAMSVEIFRRFRYYYRRMMDEAQLDMIEDADAEPETKQ